MGESELSSPAKVVWNLELLKQSQVLELQTGIQATQLKRSDSSEKEELLLFEWIAVESRDWLRHIFQ